MEETDLQGKLRQNKRDTDGGVRTELRRKPEDKQRETCIEKRCSTLWSLSDEGEGLALLIFQKGAVKRLTLIKNKDFFSDIQGEIPNDAFQMQRLSSRSGLEREPLQKSAKNGTIRKHRLRRNCLYSKGHI